MTMKYARVMEHTEFCSSTRENWVRAWQVKAWQVRALELMSINGTYHVGEHDRCCVVGPQTGFPDSPHP